MAPALRSEPVLPPEREFGAGAGGQLGRIAAEVPMGGVARWCQVRVHVFFCGHFQRLHHAIQPLAQARAELLVQELDMDGLAQTVRRMKGEQLSGHTLERPTPFALPLMVERFREQLSTESLGDRLERMVQALEVAADDTMGTHLAPTRDTTHWDLDRDTPERTARTRATRPRRGRHGF